jgi:pimeloyl-ACP methyl ester carboxylesterase
LVGAASDVASDLLRHLSTADSARDMDLLRRAAGEGRVTFLGTSYGTFLGATYAILFPNRVRAMVLVSAINPAAWVNRRVGVSAGGATSGASCVRVSALGCRG